jgi:hypothetical protein
LREHCSINVGDAPTTLRQYSNRSFQQQQAAYAGQGRVSGREVNSDVAGASSAKQGVNHGVAKYVPIAVAGQAGGMGDGHAAKHQSAPLGKGVGIGSRPYSILHRRSRRGNGRPGAGGYARSMTLRA